jgi:4-nitrophenyl phosphatase
MRELLLEKEQKEFLTRFDTFLFDCDGVLWQGSHAIEGVPQVLRYLRAQGKRILFVTNNSTKERKSGISKFSKLGMEANEDEIFGSAYCAAYYLSQNHPGKRVYAIGMPGLYTELESMGVPFIPSRRFQENITDIAEMPNVEIEPVDAVLFGLDIDLNYKKLAIAHRYLHDPNCLFLATNSDTTYPAGGSTFPGTGALLASLISSSKRNPIVLGKPHQTMLDCIVDKYHLDRSRTCMVGDRLDTDIEFGKTGGLSTLLVMTGVTTPSALKESSTKPDFVISSLGDFNKVIE